MTEEAPLISILMGVLNCAGTLDESLECLTSQTEQRWEAVICDDGSTDGTYDVLKRWQEHYPEKIVLLRNNENRGLSVTLNRCLKAARGQYAARMDGDDLCAPDRLEKELRFLRDHPDYAIVSTDMLCFDEAGTWGCRAYPTDPQPGDLVHGTPFCHAGCMVRMDALRAAGGYSENEAYERVEDYELWVRMYAMGFRGGNIHEGLYRMRDDRNAAARRKWKYRVNEARVRAEAVRKLGLPVHNYVCVLRPLILGLLPRPVSAFLHHIKLRKGIG